jgi:hypothetical protein
MSASGDDAGEVGAVILLRPRGGTASPEDLVAARIDAATPPPADVDRVARWFRSLGFTVDPPVGPTLTLSGPAALFERTFGAPAAPGAEYPLAALPPDVADHVASVSRPEPPTLY